MEYDTFPPVSRENDEKNPLLSNQWYEDYWSTKRKQQINNYERHNWKENEKGVCQKNA